MHKRLKNLFVQFFCASVLLALFGCGSNKEATEPIRIGAIQSVTGSLSYSGVNQQNTIQLAVKQINAAGGVLGRQLELESLDDASDVDQAKLAAQKLVNDGAVVVIGATTSKASKEVIDILSKKNIVQISASSTAPDISSPSDNGFFFRTCNSDLVQGKLVGTHAAQKFSKVAAINVPGPYGEGLATAFKQGFEAAGTGKATIYAYTEGRSEQQYLDWLNGIFPDNNNLPEAIFLIGYENDCLNIMNAVFSSSKFDSIGWYFSDAIAAPTFHLKILSVLETKLQGKHWLIGPFPALDEHWDYFAKASGLELDVQSIYAAFAYDAVYVAALAIAKAGKTDGAAIRDAIPMVTSANGDTFSTQQIKDAMAAIKAGKTISYWGAGGRVLFDANGNGQTGYVIANITSNGDANLLAFCDPSGQCVDAAN